MLTLAAVFWLATVVGTELWTAKAPAASPEPAGTSNQATTDVKADELLADAVEQFDRYSSVSARVRQQVDLFGQHLVGSGTYMQVRGAFGNNLTRFELKMQLQEKVSTMLEVCDGEFLWATRDLKNGDPVPEISKVDAARVLRAKPAAGQGSAAPRLALGGFSRLLLSLQQGFRFDAVAHDQIGDIAVYKLHGTWKPAQLVALLPAQKAAIEAGQGGDLEKLEPHVPDEVFVYLGAEDLFPYRVEFQRHGNTLLNCEVTELQLNLPLDMNLFHFDAGARELQTPDTTAQFLAQYGLVE
ncbi:MAG: hypothetical protein SGJ19_20335 [Planctomycetia bacterium]|nr:hypothetical protein [Planctomycetia bacterium]